MILVAERFEFWEEHTELFPHQSKMPTVTYT